MIKVARPIDELSQEEWQFHVYPYRLTAGLVMTFYGIARRSQAKHAFNPPQPKDRWDSADERHFNSGLDRPTHIPQDVIDEARALALKDVFIGWASDPAKYQ